MFSRLRAAARSLAVAAGLIASVNVAIAGQMVPPARGATGAASVPIRAVLELFTSQGCSSCPPADALLRDFAEDPSILALSLPVDYWDYLGWKDTFASPRNSERQRAYAKARGDGAIYTPQVVVNGTLHVNGAQKAEIQNAIDLTANNVAIQRVPIHFWQEDNTLNIVAESAEPGRIVTEATVWLGLVQPTGKVEISKGENAGNTLTYTNIVHELTPIALWKGQRLLIQIPRAAIIQASTQRSVVLIQEGKAGPIIGAAWADLW
ncbi:MAG TPA: DUF1223 domain-containing protein [Hyphomicrobium sp.]|nr:DUF1223 domain-containing protein [Hyphomicrobium sp.]